MVYLNCAFTYHLNLEFQIRIKCDKNYIKYNSETMMMMHSSGIEQKKMITFSLNVRVSINSGQKFKSIL